MAAFTAQWEALYHSSRQVLGDSGRQWTEGDTGSEGGSAQPLPEWGRPRQGVEDKCGQLAQRGMWMEWLRWGCLGTSAFRRKPCPWGEGSL